MSGRTANLKPFPPGVSGNPGGRTKADLEIEAFAKLHAKAAIQTLVDAMTTAPFVADRISAANKVLERAYGKPKEQVTVTHDRSVSELSESELEAVIARAGSGAGTVEAKAGAAKPH